MQQKANELKTNLPFIVELVQAQLLDLLKESGNPLLPF